MKPGLDIGCVRNLFPRMCLFAMCALILAISSANASTIVFMSDASTLSAPTASNFSGLTTGVTTGLTFVSADVGAFGTLTPVPTGAPAGTLVINIHPEPDQYGFFKVVFNLPSDATNVSISGAANVDDQGYIFINGNQIGTANESGNLTFSSNVASYFNSGLNEFLVSDINSGGGPSGAAFYATVSFDSGVSNTPLPATLPLFTTGLGALGLFGWRRKKKAQALAA